MPKLLKAETAAMKTQLAPRPSILVTTDCIRYNETNPDTSPVSGARKNQDQVHPEMSIEPRRQMDQVGEDVRSVWEKEQPRAGQAEEAPVSSATSPVFLAGQQRENKRQPGQKQIPNQKAEAQIAAPNNPRQHQADTDGRGKRQRQHRHRSFTSKSQF